MKWTLPAIRDRIPPWARKCVPIALRRWADERLRPPDDAPLFGVSRWMPAPSGRAEKKRALVSYLTRPLRMREDDPDRWKFSPLGLARSIVRALNEMEYAVDVVDWRDRRFIPSRRYDLYVGHGGINTARHMNALAAGCPRILFVSGPRLECLRSRLQARLDDIRRRRGVTLPFPFLADMTQPEEDEALGKADGMILLGNENIRQTYADKPNLHPLNNAAYGVPEDWAARRDYNVARGNFLFFAGNGNVLKGLDLLLDVFSRCEAHLYVCQTIEPDFEQAYHRELEECPNIHRVGWVPMRSPAFEELMGRCAWSILPSCSEGQPGSVLECMHYGLIPVVSGECNISTEEFGITLRECSVQEVERTVRDLSQRPPEWCAEMARRTRRAAIEKYSEERFVRSFKDSVQAILARTGPGSVNAGPGREGGLER